MNIFRDIFGINLDFFNPQKVVNIPDTTNPETIAKHPKGVIAPARTTDPGTNYGALYSFDTDKWLIYPGYQFEAIPIIRRLSIGNQSVAQALANIVNLANTGHTISFDASTPVDQVNKMRLHLDKVIPSWQYGLSGKDGLANKLISQAMISGAVCSETVVNTKLNGVYRFLMPNPETIRFIYNRTTITYEAWQKSRQIEVENTNGFGLKKLNQNAFKYFPLNGDTESPYGNPPYLPAMGPLEDQKIMLENIKFIIKQVGIMGFWEVLVTKPDQIDLEPDATYAARVKKYLSEVKDNMKHGYRDGILVGLEGDHQFKFNTASASAAGVAELFGQNQFLVASGLKQDAVFAGGTDTGGAAAGMAVVFTKLISELKNIQQTVAAQLQFTYDLELRLAGFSYECMTVAFGQSTIQDDLKVQQGQEIKVRNARQKRADGIIGPDQHAQELGYEKPFQTKPNAAFQPIKATKSGDPTADAIKKKAREDGKNASDRKVRQKNK